MTNNFFDDEKSNNKNIPLSRADKEGILLVIKAFQLYRRRSGWLGIVAEGSIEHILCKEYRMTSQDACQAIRKAFQAEILGWGVMNPGEWDVYYEFCEREAEIFANSLKEGSKN